MTIENNVKEVIQEFGKTFEEFKKANDERLENLEKGESVASVEEKMTAIESKLDSLEVINQEITKAKSSQESISEKLENLETVLKRPNSGFDTPK